MNIKKLTKLLLIAALFTPSAVKAQMIIDTWSMTTGVDTTLWYNIDGVDSVIIASGYNVSACSGVRNIGFDFTLGVATYRTADEMPENLKRALPPIDELRQQLALAEEEARS